MSADQPVAASVRDVILARCDELERVARAAAGPRDLSRWASGAGDPCAVADWMAYGTRALDRARAAKPEIAAHMAAWDPGRVVALVAGAREMCEVHQPADDPGYHQPACRGCGMDRTGEWMERIGDCPTLAALARMLGADNV